MENANILSVGARMFPNGHFEGYVICNVDNAFKWQQNTDIERLNKPDAMHDATILRDEIAEFNCLVKSD